VIPIRALKPVSPFLRQSGFSVCVPVGLFPPSAGFFPVPALSAKLSAAKGTGVILCNWMPPFHPLFHSIFGTHPLQFRTCIWNDISYFRVFGIRIDYLRNPLYSVF